MKKQNITIKINPIATHTKTLLTCDEFNDLILRKKISDKDKVKALKEYGVFLKDKPKRTDFINFDKEGFYLSENKPIFKGFVTCDETSSDDNKVAIFDGTRIYFMNDEKKDVVIQNDQFLTDDCTYNEVAIAFNKKNSLKPLVFV